jgi:molybdenum cofactor guanylyltransferase
MEPSGFVLAGGLSSRMGRDKALLPYRGKTLIEHVAGIVGEALPDTSRPVAIIGDPSRYGNLGYPVHPDSVPGCGPLGGIYTALKVSTSDWNLLVACDMPMLSPVGLRALLDCAQAASGSCLTAAALDGQPEPLCALYHRRCLPVLNRAIREKRFKMRGLLAELDWETVVLSPEIFANVNTPAEWIAFEGLPG